MPDSWIQPGPAARPDRSSMISWVPDTLAVTLFCTPERALSTTVPLERVTVEPGGWAAAGGTGEYAFAYLNLRLAKGRSAAVREAVGNALRACAEAHFAPLLATRHIGVTLQIDEGAEVYNARLSSLHPLFSRG